MADWQAGDLALCVKGGHLVPNPENEVAPIAGRVYEVEAVRLGAFRLAGRSLALAIKGCPHNRGGWWHGRFRKVTPHKPTADDREVIDLMLGRPARVGADA